MKIFELIKAMAKLPFLILSWMVAKILSDLMAKMKIGTVICRKQQILTPIVYLNHQKTGRKIILVGVMHIGDEGYYPRIQGVIDGLKNYAVLYEEIGAMSEEEIKSLSIKEKQVYDWFKEAQKARVMIQALLRVQGQKEGLRYDKSWIRTDMSMYQFIRRIIKRKAVSFFKITSTEALTAESNDEFRNDIRKVMFEMVANMILTRISGLSLLQKVSAFFSKTRRGVDTIILAERNEMGLDGIYWAAEKSDVISIWGAAHIPGMIKNLKNSGYEEEGRVWITAFSAKRTYAQEFFKKYQSTMEQFGAKKNRQIKKDP